MNPKKADEIIEKILSTLAPLHKEMSPLHAWEGKVLAEDIYAERDYPPFNRSMMDGIAVCLKEEESLPEFFSLEKILKAGDDNSFDQKVKHGAVEIMTGASLPTQINTVIPYEHLSIEEDKAFYKHQDLPRVGQFVHGRGTDYKEGEKLLEAGVRIGPVEMGILASQGRSEVLTTKKCRVALVSTGDELVDVTEKCLRTEEVRRSNPYVLLSFLQSRYAVDLELVHLKDEWETVVEGLSSLLEKMDVVLISGGVSKGKFDFIPRALEELKCHCHIHGVAQKPGKPLWFGHKNNTVVFGLPGNPVSTLTCARRYVTRVLDHYQAKSQVRAPWKLRVKGPLKQLAGKTNFMPVRILEDKQGCYAEGVPINNSGDFYALKGSSGFVEIPPLSEKNAELSCFPYYAWDKS